MNVKIDLEQIEGISATSVANWNQAYQWGPHTNMGYLTNIPLASATVVGGGKLVTNTVQAVAVAVVYNTASRTYAIQLNSSGQMVVNVPWVNDNTTYTLMTLTELNTGTATTARTINASVLTSWGNGKYAQLSQLGDPTTAVPDWSAALTTQLTF